MNYFSLSRSFKKNFYHDFLKLTSIFPLLLANTATNTGFYQV